MVAQFVHQHMGHHFAQGIVVILGPIVENGAAIQKHRIGQLPGLRHGPVLGQANASKQAHQLEWALHAKTFEDIVLGVVGHSAGDVGRKAAERLG